MPCQYYFFKDFTTSLSDFTDLNLNFLNALPKLLSFELFKRIFLWLYFLNVLWFSHFYIAFLFFHFHLVNTSSLIFIYYFCTSFYSYRLLFFNFLIPLPYSPFFPIFKKIFLCWYFFFNFLVVSLHLRFYFGFLCCWFLIFFLLAISCWIYLLWSFDKHLQEFFLTIRFDVLYLKVLTIRVVKHIWLECTCKPKALSYLVISIHDPHNCL